MLHDFDGMFFLYTVHEMSNNIIWFNYNIYLYILKIYIKNVKIFVCKEIGGEVYWNNAAIGSDKNRVHYDSSLFKDMDY